MKIFSTARVFVCCFVIGAGGIAKGDDRTTAPSVEAKKITAAKASPENDNAAGAKAEKTEAEEEPKAMSIGSLAPALDIEHWVGDSPSPMSNFEPGKVYVVEFWATWCGPCLYSMPHLAEMQSKYEDQGVRVVSVSTEDLETVTEFLKRTVSPRILGIEVPKEEPGDEGEESAEEEKEEPKSITFGELTSAYSLTTDPDKSVHEDYMKAASQNGIPTAFIVGKDGHVEWIGHPMSMDKPLEAIVNGDWDRAAAKEKFDRDQQIKLAFQKIIMAHRAGLHDTTLELLRDNAGLFEGTRYETALKSIWFPTALATQQSDIALEIIQERVEASPEDAVSMNRWAWEVYEAVESGWKDSDEILSTTIGAMESALASEENESNDEMWPAYDTLAHLKALAGDKESAIEWQLRAIEAAPDDEKENLGAYLSELTGVEPEVTEDLEDADEETTQD
ncbi:TlpA disulfide reductase family protein [Rhodopirellula bahusiensis]|uniref:Thiol:disulfide interchange protein n=1 Tax=Rhodopirellula bahusiensis TaxID=2014065 RepID=A0A2G1W9I3_9BACT|nr:TlpA disulfide reductase family protein [Rhodopirellula bahusiensis]PHQ35692.1 thiol:disulfide interchange protein [Rhodopirellula bahusiensis]